jgi:hypothetical protein
MPSSQDSQGLNKYMQIWAVRQDRIGITGQDKRSLGCTRCGIGRVPEPRSWAEVAECCVLCEPVCAESRVEFVFAQIFQCQGIGMFCYARTCDGLKELP